MNGCVLIVGTGCGGVETAFAMRANGWQGPIVLIGEEKEIPYHRPPLSKAYLAGDVSPESLYLKSPALFEKQGIVLRLGVKALSINREDRLLALSSGESIKYDYVVLATGGQPRQISFDDGLPYPTNILQLRDKLSSERIANQISSKSRLAIIGGGYIGLEVAATARKFGCEVTLIEAANRVLERVTAPVVSEFYQNRHSSEGVNLLLGTTVRRFIRDGSGQIVRSIECDNGMSVDVDAIVVGIGLIPSIELAAESGLDCGNGILVNEELRTSDPRIFAIGDCVNFPSSVYGGRRVRIESVPNALEHARKVSAVICSKVPRPDAAPWFWSDQYNLSLKMVGLSTGYDSVVVRGEISASNFSVLYLLEGRVIAVDTVNRASDFIAAKKMVGSSRVYSVAELQDESFSLKELAESTGS